MRLAYGDPAHTAGVGYSVLGYNRKPRVNSRADYDAGVRFFKRILNEGIPAI